MPAVQRSRRNWGEPPWQTLPLQRVARSFPATPDVAIVGGGLTGVATAYYLARRGIRAVLFEADRVGSGASGRTGGLTLEGLATGPRDGARDCLAGLRRIVEEAGLDCGLDLRGC